jgi:hypothetical protein
MLYVPQNVAISDVRPHMTTMRGAKQHAALDLLCDLVAPHP